MQTSPVSALNQVWPFPSRFCRRTQDISYQTLNPNLKHPIFHPDIGARLSTSSGNLGRVDSLGQWGESALARMQFPRSQHPRFVISLSPTISVPSQWLVAIIESLALCYSRELDAEDNSPLLGYPSGSLLSEFL